MSECINEIFSSWPRQSRPSNAAHQLISLLKFSKAEVTRASSPTSGQLVSCSTRHACVVWHSPFQGNQHAGAAKINPKSRLLLGHAWWNKRLGLNYAQEDSRSWSKQKDDSLADTHWSVDGFEWSSCQIGLGFHQLREEENSGRVWILQQKERGRWQTGRSVPWANALDWKRWSNEEQHHQIGYSCSLQLH